MLRLETPEGFDFKPVVCIPRNVWHCPRSHTPSEEQVEKIDSRLYRLEKTLNEFVHNDRPHASSQPPFGTSPSGESPSLQVGPRHPTPSVDEMSYQGESSFETHSKEASEILENTLQSSSASVLNQDTSTALGSLRLTLKPDRRPRSTIFHHDLPLPPLHLAVKAMRLSDSPRNNFFLSMTMIDIAQFKEACRKIYFPVEGYSSSEFIIACGGLYYLLRDAHASELNAYDIEVEEAAQAAVTCEENISRIIGQFTPFLEPSVNSISALRMAAQLAVAQSKPAVAWSLISLAARLCLDSGLHRLKDDQSDRDLNLKKACFWTIYILDKSLALNFGRAPCLLDFDITVGYPPFPGDKVYSLPAISFEFSRLQGKLYEKLYSGQAQLQASEKRAQSVWEMSSEIHDLLDRCKLIEAKAPAEVREFLHDPVKMTEMLIYTNLTLTYKQLPAPEPSHPFRFSEQCIAAARKTLELHQKLSSTFLSRTSLSFRMYIEWYCYQYPIYFEINLRNLINVCRSLLFCPFTPFIVILGTAILKADHNDMNLLSEVVVTLEKAGEQATGAKRLHEICMTLFQGAKACCEQNPSGWFTSPSSYNEQTLPRSGNNTGEAPNHPPYNEAAGNIFPDILPPLSTDNANEMSTLFEDYMLGNASVMGFFDADTTQFDVQYQ
ncbi:MAG: hypothetical protein Q9227_007293 [Pyrenula ochraceoflavens]